MRKAVVLIVLVLFTLTSCVSTTMVRFDSNVDGAEVRLDDRPVGHTPMVMKISNGIWENPNAMVSADGYRDLHTELDKELKAINLVFGLILWWPSLLYVWGPDSYQYYQLVEE